MRRSLARLASSLSLVRRCATLACLCGYAGLAAALDSRPEAFPSFAELEAAGAVIGEIRIDNQDIFDLQDAEENNILFRAVNALHITTAPQVIRRQLLFRSGERVSARRIDETERLLRAHGYLYDVIIRPIAYHDGVVDIDVTTRDTWSLVPGLSFSRAGGANRRQISLRDSNALGSGAFFGLSRTNDPTRAGNEIRFAHPNAIDGRTNVEVGSAQLSDGRRRNFALNRPFYALDTRWSAGVRWVSDDRVESTYSNGNTLAQYRHRQDRGEVAGGLSDGLVGGMTRRYLFGISYLKDDYTAEPGPVAPGQPPVSAQLVAPFMGYEVVQDAFEKVRNLNQIERTEYFLMGLQARAQLGRSLATLGSTQEVWLYTASVSDGHRFTGSQMLLTQAALEGQSGYGPIERRQIGTSARYYGSDTGRTRFYASIAADMVRGASSTGQILLGGDTGLRGYPRNYQSGDRRLLLTVEERVYSDWYPFRLFRVGAAVFFDSGRAWGGPTQNTLNAGWLSDFGIGLRILSTRSAFGNVVHIDLSFPTHHDPGIARTQLLVQTKLSF